MSENYNNSSCLIPLAQNKCLEVKVKFPGSFATKKLSFPNFKPSCCRLPRKKVLVLAVRANQVKCQLTGPGLEILPSLGTITMLGGKKNNFQKLQHINSNSIQLETFLKWHSVICEYESWRPCSMHCSCSSLEDPKVQDHIQPIPNRKGSLKKWTKDLRPHPFLNETFPNSTSPWMQSSSGKCFHPIYREAVD